MVRALLAGTKTQTRRLLTKPTPPVDADGVRAWFAPPEVPAKGIPNQWAESGLWAFKHADEEDPENCAGGYNRYCGPLRYRPGDRLYVREGWAVKRFEPCLPHEREWQSLHGPTVRYLSDGAEIAHQGDRSTGRGIYHGAVEKARPSIHMPRWASRLWLSVTEVRVQRLQDISEADAIAEGIDEAAIKHFGCPIKAYAALWNHLHGAENDTSWEANPWVVAVSFDVNRGNIDAGAA